ncbi:hypothetical protein M758_UG231900 [Ceratodon purpureus]|nr:hypothetical protein M758_UG231900 [Ceratodon purpureus]
MSTAVPIRPDPNKVGGNGLLGDVKPRTPPVTLESKSETVAHAKGSLKGITRARTCSFCFSLSERCKDSLRVYTDGVTPPSSVTCFSDWMSKHMADDPASNEKRTFL